MLFFKGGHFARSSRTFSSCAFSFRIKSRGLRRIFDETRNHPEAPFQTLMSAPSLGDVGVAPFDRSTHEHGQTLALSAWLMISFIPPVFSHSIVSF